MQRLTTKQLIFNRVYRGLIKQGKRSQTGGDVPECKYRYKSLRCAAGFCITDSNYSKKLEGCLCDQGIVKKAISKSIKRTLSEEEIAFLRDLQDIHDTDMPTFWKKRFKEIAEENNLTIPEVK